MGIRSFLAENKKARQEREETSSWWHRKKHLYDDLQPQTQSWNPEIIEENKRVYEDELSRPLRDEESDEMPTPKDSELMATSRYDFVPSYEIPAAMIALKGSPTNNVGRFLQWKGEERTIKASAPRINVPLCNRCHKNPRPNGYIGHVWCVACQTNSIAPSHKPKRKKDA